jgi:hypothetical protein
MRASARGLPPLSQETLLRPAARARAFRGAEPFAHAVFDGFLDRDFCARLAAEFPAYDAERFRNSHGQAGKAAYPDVRALGPAFRRFDDAMSSKEFLRFLSGLSGLAELAYDPSYLGGGAQENLPGMGLWPHIDFDRRSAGGARRRLNLLLYLNEKWRPECGGCLLLHRDPKNPQDRPTRIEPLFNRCVIFATTDDSWHSVEPVRSAPPGAAPSRRSVSLYYYDAAAPAGEKTPVRRTVWIFPGLPDSIRPGAILDQAAIDGAERALALRDIEVADLSNLPAGSLKWKSPLPARWRPGLRLEAEDVRWIRKELAARDMKLDVLWRRR